MTVGLLRLLEVCLAARWIGFPEKNARPAGRQLAVDREAQRCESILGGEGSEEVGRQSL